MITMLKWQGRRGGIEPGASSEMREGPDRNSLERNDGAPSTIFYPSSYLCSSFLIPFEVDFPQVPFLKRSKLPTGFFESLQHLKILMLPVIFPSFNLLDELYEYSILVDKTLHFYEMLFHDEYRTMNKKHLTILSLENICFDIFIYFTRS